MTIDLETLCTKVHDDRLSEFSIQELQELKRLEQVQLADRLSKQVYMEFVEADGPTCDYNPDIFPNLDAKLKVLALLTALTLPDNIREALA